MLPTATPAAPAVTKSRLRRPGFTLVEWTVVAGLGALAYYLVFGQGRDASDQQSTDIFVTGVGQLQANMRSAYGVNFPSTGTYSCQDIIEAKIAPAAWDPRKAGSARNPWGGCVSLTMTGPLTYEIVSPSVPQAACLQILTRMGPAQGYLTAGVTALNAMPYADIATAKAQCGTTNTLRIQTQ